MNTNNIHTHQILSIILSLATLSYGTYNGYTYGDYVSDYKWGSITPIAQYSNVQTAAACETKCKDYSGADDCNNWAWKASTEKCVIGEDATLTTGTGWTSGWNKDICDDILNCAQNSVCSSWSDETFSVSGSKRTLSSGDDTRCYYAYVPSNCIDNINNKCKVVFNFGGVAKDAIPWANDRIDLTERITGEATSGGWSTPGIVIYPQKYAITAGWRFLPGRNGLCNTYNDVEFVADILHDLEHTNNKIYWDKVYALGSGVGAHFVLDLAARLYDEESIQLSAVGAYAGNSLTDYEETVDIPSTPLSVLLVQGYNDNTHDYWGHKTIGCDTGKEDSQTLADWWGDKLGCDVSPTIDACWSGTAPNCNGQNGEKNRYYTNCDNSVRVELKSTNSGHSFTTAGDTVFPDFFKDY